MTSENYEKLKAINSYGVPGHLKSKKAEYERLIADVKTAVADYEQKLAKYTAKELDDPKNEQLQKLLRGFNDKKALLENYEFEYQALMEVYNAENN